MKKKLIQMFCVVVLMIIMGANAVYAKESSVSQNDSIKSEETVIQPRSLYLASGISEITNKGNGVLHIYADFASYQSVPWAQLVIKLERTKSASEEYKSVKTYTYTFKEEDQPDGILIYGSADFDTSAFATGYYYRLTCTHKVKTPSGSYETKTSRTNGVLLTPYPDFRSPAKPN
ncbi:MAG: hypothetical protein HFG74_03050 [Hungatella sp.]|nr:hypothetical protein [Hungatella sp.]